MPFITINDRNLHYFDTHQLSTPFSKTSQSTLILIHGLGSSQNFYFPILPFLSKYRCIALDTYGSGRSSFTNHSSSLQTLVDDVIGVLNFFDVEQAVIVGHSMGGMVASAVAALAPERVLAVIGIGPITPSEMVTTAFEKRIEVVLKDGMEPLGNSVPKVATGSGSTPLQQAFIRELLLAQAPEGYASLCRVIIHAKVPNYQAIRAPFLIIAGEEDKSAPLDGCTLILDSISSSQKKIEILKRVGHWHCIEASEQVGTAIAEFLRSVDLIKP